MDIRHRAEGAYQKRLEDERSENDKRRAAAFERNATYMAAELANIGVAVTAAAVLPYIDIDGGEYTDPIVGVEIDGIVFRLVQGCVVMDYVCPHCTNEQGNPREANGNPKPVHHRSGAIGSLADIGYWLSADACCTEEVPD